tara:strand:- start:10588 stop:12006 length:1419 start_codon:yes stop_codon:yes gene_type:complete
MNPLKNTLFRFFTIIALFCIAASGNDIKACDTSPVITLSNTTDIGGGFFTVDIQICIGDGGSASGFTTSFTGGLNIIAFTPATLVDNNTATGSIAGGVLNYNYAGGTGPANMFVNEFDATCFNYTVTLDGDPVGLTANFDGINSGHTGSCTIGAGGGTGASVVPAPPLPPPVCGATFFDPAGSAANYASPTLITYTICPDVPGEMVTISFASFNIENGWDFFYVWDANTDAGAPMSTFTGSTVPGPITATNASGCLTMTFDADAIINAPGYEIIVSCPTILPIELTYFTGDYMDNNQSNLLNWVTASEINNDYFILERGVSSAGQINWENIDHIPGAGNSNSILKYGYEDFSPAFNTVNYYRLKQVDFDGESEYSQIVSINNDSRVNYEVSDLYPNPTNKEFSFETSIKSNSETISFQIYNSLGYLVKSDQIFSTMDRSNFNVGVTDLNDGLYFVHLNIDGVKQVKKLTIVR